MARKQSRSTSLIPNPDQLEQAKKLRKAEAQIRNLRLQLSELQITCEEQAKRLERKAVKAFAITPSRSRSPGGSFNRVVIPDVHGSSLEKSAVRAFLADLKSLEPREIVVGGDFVDCGGFLAEHHVEHYVAETDYAYEDDIAAGNALLDSISNLAPNAVVHFLEGNHERRVERWILTQRVRNKSNADFLRKAVHPENLLNLKERGIKYYKEDLFHMGLNIRGSIKLGNCYFTHGFSTAKHAASATLDKFSGNVVFFHTHREDSCTKKTVHHGVIKSWNPGCLCKLQPMYSHTRPTDWSHGYGLQICRSDGTFLHINVPIIDGVSLLRTLTKRL